MELLDLFALVAQGYVLRKYREPQVFECWLEGPDFETVPFDREHYDAVRAAVMARVEADRIRHSDMSGSNSIESSGYRPDLGEEPDADDPSYLSCTGTLEVRFKGTPDKPGSLYRYYGVTRAHQIAFLKAESARSYLNGFIAKTYPYERMSDRAPVATCSTRLALRNAITAAAEERSRSLQALYDSAPRSVDAPETLDFEGVGA